MLKTGQILVLLFLFNYLYCAPDRYIRDNQRKTTRYNYSERDEDYAWSDASKNIDYNTPSESNSYSSRNKQENFNNDNYLKALPAEEKETTVRRQKPAYIIYDRPESDNGRRPAVKNKNYSRPQKKIVKLTEKCTAYTVRNGDSITGIAKRFNLKVDDICRFNKITNPNDIYAGMILKLVPEGNTSKKITKRDDKKEISLSFQWPLKDVISVKRDGDDGVRSIGIIITGKNGSKIYSSAAGTVKKIGQMRGFGNFVILKHQDRYFTIYSNLNNIFVSEGEKVGAGKTIARLEGNKLHFQIDNSGKPEDPLKYLSRRR